MEINPWISVNVKKDDSRAKEIYSQLYLKQHPASSVKTTGGKKSKTYWQSIDMMDKSREAENNTSPGFKDTSNQKQQQKTQLKTSSNQTDNCCQHCLVCQYSRTQNCVELNLTRKEKTWKKFKIQVIPQKPFFIASST